jgi:diguanylate cyclase (GGDEF)-like protein
MRPPSVTRLPCLLACGLLLAQALMAVPSERGFPLIQTYEPTVPEASTQSFGITRDAQGVLYVANANGVLVYDGAWWRRIPVPGNSVFAVAADPAGRIAVGATNEIGTLAPGPDGALRYVSLLHLLPPEQRQFGQVLQLETTGQGFAFTIDRGILVWDGTRIVTVATAPGDRPFPALFKMGSEVYVWTRDLGITRLAGAQLAPVPGGDVFRGRRVDQILPADGSLLVSVREEGFFLLCQGQAVPFAPAASRWAKQGHVLEGLRLPDGRWALGSVLSGALLLRTDGEVDQVIDSSVGLPDNFVSGMVVDREGSLWLSLNTGLARVEVASPLSVIDRRSGLQGIIYTLARYRGTLWAGTPAGVFTLGRDTAGGPARARAVPGMPTAVWSLLPLDDDLLVGTAFGVFQWHGDHARLIPGTDIGTSFALIRSRQDPERIWVGMDENVLSLRRTGTEWRFEGEALKGPIGVRVLVEDERGGVWIVTQGNGIHGLEIPAGWPATGSPRERRVRGSEICSGLAWIGPRIVAACGNKALRLDPEKGELVADADLATLGGHGAFELLAEDGAGDVWMSTAPPSLAVRSGTGWAREPRSLVEIAARDISVLRVEPDGVVWLATDKGLYRYETTTTGKETALPAPLLARGTAADRTLFLGGAPGAGPQSVELPPYLRRLRIEFAPLSFRAGLRYQTRLDPVDVDWSGPSPEPFTELTRLPPGDYTFHVRTLAPNQEVTKETAWSFSVRAPWYQTPWAFLLWVGLAIAALTGYAWLRSRALRQRAARLEARVAEQTVELRRTVDDLRHAHAGLAAANSRLEELSLRDELTGIANRRHLRKALDEEWERARSLGEPVAFALLDLDHFKLLNDTRGHREGDLCLQAVAHFLAESELRTGGFVARYGGEEFAVLLPHADLGSALQTAEHLREGLEKLALPHDAAPLGRVTASFGVAAMIPTPDQRPEMLIEAADLALYRAKTEGRNRVRAGGNEAQLASARAGA